MNVPLQPPQTSKPPPKGSGLRFFLGLLSRHYKLLKEINEVIFLYNAKIRENQTSLRKANLNQLFDGECKRFMGTWQALFRYKEADLIQELSDLKGELKDYEKAFSHMGEGRRDIAQMLEEQKKNYTLSIRKAEKDYEKIQPK